MCTQMNEKSTSVLVLIELRIQLADEIIMMIDIIVSSH
jgi:hypothetical protein